MNGNNQSNACGTMTAFLLGAIVGGGVALLYTPRSGKETRKLIASRSNEMKEKAGSAIDHARNAIHEKKDQLASAVEAGIQAVHTQREKIADSSGKG